VVICPLGLKPENCAYLPASARRPVKSDLRPAAPIPDHGRKRKGRPVAGPPFLV